MTSPTTSPAPDREYEFTLVLSGIPELTTAVEDALFEAGCNDATLSVRSGRVHLTFARTAATLQDAILSALRDVANAGVGAVVRAVEAGDPRLTEEVSRVLESR